MKYVIDVLIWIGWAWIGYTWYPLLHDVPEKCLSQNEWRQAPHEQQPEPMMAQAVGGVERRVL